MPDGIQIRGPHQFRVQVRRNGVYLSKTFETLRAAQQWRRVTDGQVSGDIVVDARTAKHTTLGQPCDWMLEGSRAGTNANSKNIKAIANWGNRLHRCRATIRMRVRVASPTDVPEQPFRCLT
jgi:hypothetical protein